MTDKIENAGQPENTAPAPDENNPKKENQEICSYISSDELDF